MGEELDPERSESRPSPRSQPAPGDVGFTPKPEFSQPRSKAPVLAAAGLAAVMGLGVSWQFYFRPSLAEKTAVVETAPVPSKILLFAAKDLDWETTKQARQALQKGEIPPALKAADPVIRQEVQEGARTFYSIRLLDTAADDGDVVLILIDGKPFGPVELSSKGATLTVPLRPGAQTVLSAQALKDGGGGVTFGAESSTGEIRTRVMSVGEQEIWTLNAP